MTTSRTPQPALLPVDERLVVPEQGFEIVDGEVVEVSPAEEPHGRGHSKLAAVLEAHVVEGWTVAVDMLTRTSRKSDAAPDASVYPEARDPQTGGRQLEALAFEVLDSQSIGSAGAKAKALSERGVRRVFAVDVRRARVLEWSTESADWALLAAAAAIADPLFVIPIPVPDLLTAARADDVVARALLAKANPVIEAALAARFDEGRSRGRAEGRSRGRAEGRTEGRRAALTDTLLDLITARGWQLSASQARAIHGASEPQLQAWARGVLTADRLHTLLHATPE